jgi:hypothetical protein
VFVVFAIQIIVGIPFTRTKEGVSVFAIFSALVIRVVDYLLQAPSVPQHRSRCQPSLGSSSPVW